MSEDILSLVAGIYDAALDPSRWAPVLERIADRAHGATTALSVHDPSRHWGAIVAGVRGMGWRLAAEGVAREGHQPAHGVAEVVGEVAVVAVDEALVREAGVLAEDHLAQQEVADAVAAEAR